MRILDGSTNEYPERLRGIEEVLRTITVCGAADLNDTRPRVAIVGSRSCDEQARAFASELAATLVRADAIVVSGGALGIDSAAHYGALGAGGATWMIMPCGSDSVTPPSNGPLVREVAASAGAVVYPYPRETLAFRGCYHGRNRIIAALSDAMVVAQAGYCSGALNAASYAREFRRPIFAVLAPPWIGGYAGCFTLLRKGALPLYDINAVLRLIGRTKPKVDPRLMLSLTDATVLRSVSRERRHIDQIVTSSGLPSSTVMSGLLTLALENVVVEGPPGFFRRSS